MDKVNIATPDLTQENIEKIAALFPDAVTEILDGGVIRRAIDFDALRDDLSGEIVDGSRERYQLTWPGKRAAKLEARTPCDKTMRPERGKSVDWDTTENLYIEGDNLEALKLLRETYAGKVKLIYIDPPYNTGHDFIYDDDFAQTKADYDAESGDYDAEGGRLVANPESNGRFHSDWCSMMYPRLLLARDLLSSDGAIFISMDDSEITNLRSIGAEVFGDGNLFAQIIWQKRTSPDARRNLNAAHDYILVLAKTADALKASLHKIELSDERKAEYKNPDNDPRGPWASVDITGQTGHATASQFYEITTPNGTKMTPPRGRCWALSKATFNKLREEGRIWFGEDGGSRPRQKKYLSESEGGNAWTWWPNTEVGHNQEASKELVELLGSSDIFQNPKPTRLLNRVLKLSSNSNSTILDFFSGSASTAHAVMKLNAEDGGNRKFIMVQLPEVCDEKSEAAKAGYHTICEIGEERIRRAGEKIREEVEAANAQLKLGEEPKRVPDIGFRVLKIDSSNFEDVYATPEDTSQQALFDLADNLKSDRTAADLLFEALPAFQIPFSAKIERIDVAGFTAFDVDGGALIACFDTGITNDAITAMAKREPSYCVVRDASFADAASAANFEQIFKTVSPATACKVI